MLILTRCLIVSGKPGPASPSRIRTLVSHCVSFVYILLGGKFHLIDSLHWKLRLVQTEVGAEGTHL